MKPGLSFFCLAVLSLIDAKNVQIAQFVFLVWFTNDYFYWIRTKNRV